MVMITSVSIDSGTGFNAKTSEIKLAADKTSYERITVELTEEETAEVIKLVSEIIATRLRMPAVKEKLGAAKSIFPPAYPVPGSSADVPVKATETVSLPPMAACIHGNPLSLVCLECAEASKPDEVFPDARTCKIHQITYFDPECPKCKEEYELARPRTDPNDDIPF